MRPPLRRGPSSFRGVTVRIAAILTIERAGRQVPLARTRRPDVVRRVAEAAVDDVRACAVAEPDEALRSLLTQEADRLERGFVSLGLTEVPAR